MRLRTKVLAATLATSAQDLATARCRLACKETVAACAHEIAGLKCPLHIVLEIKTGAILRRQQKGPPDQRRPNQSARLGDGSLRVKIYADDRHDQRWHAEILDIK